MFYCYILQSQKSGRYYVGSTADLEARLLEHNSGRVTATHSKGPWERVYEEEFATRSAACTREKQLKSWKSAVALANLIASR